MSYNSVELPILHKKHQFSELFAEHMHRQGHLGVSDVVAKIRIIFIGIEHLVKHIRHHCMWCKKMYNKPESQVMGGGGGIERLKPTPP